MRQNRAHEFRLLIMAIFLVTQAVKKVDSVGVEVKREGDKAPGWKELYPWSLSTNSASSLHHRVTSRPSATRCQQCSRNSTVALAPRRACGSNWRAGRPMPIPAFIPKDRRG